jgi:hypothetical protein
MCYAFPTQNDLKEGDILLPLLFNFALKYAIKKVQQNLAELELNGTNHPLIYAGGINMFGENIKIIAKTKKLC